VVLAPLVPIANPALPAAKADPVAALSTVRVPLLIVHGTADEVIPFSHGEQLAAAAPPGTQFVPVDGARHMESLTRADVQRRVVEAMVAAVR
jgi:pimeloyl-ACP methyl ester carboxylesterase